MVDGLQVIRHEEGCTLLYRMMVSRMWDNYGSAKYTFPEKREAIALEAQRIGMNAEYMGIPQSLIVLKGENRWTSKPLTVAASA
jgi:hypothetical protein